MWLVALGPLGGPRPLGTDSRLVSGWGRFKQKLGGRYRGAGAAGGTGAAEAASQLLRRKTQSVPKGWRGVRPCSDPERVFLSLSLPLPLLKMAPRNALTF